MTEADRRAVHGALNDFGSNAAALPRDDPLVAQALADIAIIGIQLSPDRVLAP